ncbi:MAG: amidase [Emcibacter sp.]|nr:amidase [Emcibacter sp.]
MDRRAFIAKIASTSVAATLFGSVQNSQAKEIQNSKINTSQTDITAFSAVKLSTMIKNRDLSCAEVMSAYLDRIDRLNPLVNAIVALQSREKLMEAAHHKDRELASGTYFGWMHGMPHAVKDLALTAGIKTTFGSPLFKDFIPEEDKLIVSRMRKTGAIFIGKTNVPEFGLGCQTYNNIYGTTANAYDQSKTSGGSSGGAAVSLATHMVPVADGSDMAGSLRNPASFNNVVGFRPSFGSIPYLPAGDVFSAPMGTEGALGRTVSDVAMLHSTLAGYDSRYPLSLKQDTGRFTENLKKDFKGAKIGWLGDLKGYLPMEDGIMDMCEDALKNFEALGCTVDHAMPKTAPEDAWAAWLVLRNFQVGGGLVDLYRNEEKRALMKPEVQWEVENYLKRSADDVYVATKRRTLWYQSIDTLFDHFDYLILPGAQAFPFDKNIHWLKTVNGREMKSYHQWMTVYCLMTLTGCPVINMPIGFYKNGLPMGIQIVARNQSDLAALQMGYAFEEASGHIARIRPEITK